LLKIFNSIALVQWPASIKKSTNDVFSKLYKERALERNKETFNTSQAYLWRLLHRRRAPCWARGDLLSVRWNPSTVPSSWASSSVNSRRASVWRCVSCLRCFVQYFAV